MDYTTRINRNIMEFKGTNERMGRKMFSKRINRNIMEFKVTFMTIISVWTI